MTEAAESSPSDDADADAALVQVEPRSFARTDALPHLHGPHYPMIRGVMAALAVEAVALPLFLITHSVVGLLVPVLIFLAWATSLRRKGHEVLRLCNRGADLLDRGHLDEAAAIFDTVLTKHRGATHLLAVAAFHRARVEFYRGNLSGARVRLEQVLASGWFEQRRMLQALAPQVHATLAVTLALQGELDAAEQVSARGKAAPNSLERWWVFSDAVIDLRRGRPAALIHRLEQQRDDIEATLSGRALRQLQLFEAFALAQLAGDNYRGLHSGDDIEALLHGIRPGMFDYMTGEWPELREFMQARRLLGRAH